jgi:hypothetical protein
MLRAMPQVDGVEKFVLPPYMYCNGRVKTLATFSFDARSERVSNDVRVTVDQHYPGSWPYSTLECPHAARR